MTNELREQTRKAAENRLQVLSAAPPPEYRRENRRFRERCTDLARSYEAPGDPSVRIVESLFAGSAPDPEHRTGKIVEALESGALCVEYGDGAKKEWVMPEDVEVVGD